MEELDSWDFVFYPNPTQDLIHIELPQNKSDVNIIIWDATGRVLKRISEEELKLKTQFSTANFALGLYRVGLMQNDMLLRIKNLIKE